MINNSLGNFKNIISVILEAIFSVVLETIYDLLSSLKENTIQKLLPLILLLIYLFINKYNFLGFNIYQNTEVYLILLFNLVMLALGTCSEIIPEFAQLISTVVDDSLETYYKLMKIIFIFFSLLFTLSSTGTLLLAFTKIPTPLINIVNIMNQVV